MRSMPPAQPTVTTRLPRRRLVVGSALALAAGGGLLAAWTWLRPEPALPAGQAQAIIDEALDFMQSRALRREQVDWPRVRAEALQRATGGFGAGGTTALDRALAWSVAQLDDAHSHYLPPADTARVAAPPVDDPARTANQPPPIDARSIASLNEPIAGVPWLRLNSFNTIDPQVMAQAATHLRQLVVRALSEHPCGLVLDLADNGGGNVWPMLQGLLPLLSEGPLGGFAEGDGRWLPIERKAGAVWLAGRAFFPDEPIGLQQGGTQPRVALLTSSRTASAAELVVIAFAGQPGTRRYGAATAGLNTANTPKRLAHGGTLAVATSVAADRSGQRHTAALLPDEEVAERVSDLLRRSRAAAERGAAWVASGC
jgi:carboxyl-terminal processing protease